MNSCDIITILANDPSLVLLGFAGVVSEPATIAFCSALETGEVVWMPAGNHTINAGTSTGGSWSGSVRVDEAAFRAVEASFQRATSAGYPPWIDFDHEDKGAAAWVKAFSWDPTRGIVAKVEWTPAGRRALEEKQYRSFSPAFTISKESGKVTGIFERHAAGGLVNAPAFGAAMPALVAARVGGEEITTNTTHNTMNRQQMLALLASLGVQHDANSTDEQLVNLLASYKPAAPAATPEAQPTAAPQPAVQASTLATPPARPEPAVVPVLASINTQPAAPVSASEGAIESLRLMARERDHRRRSAIYAGVRPIFAEGERVGAILAANSLGTLAGPIALMRSLDLLMIELPMLNSISTDFSDASIKQGQTVYTRLLGVPPVKDYNPDNGYEDSDVSAADVPVVIDQHKYVQIAFNQSELAQTGRDLFGEQIQGCSYSLAKAISDHLFTKVTSTAFTNNTTVALASFARASITSTEKDMANRGVGARRSMLLNPDYWEKIGGDTALVNLAVWNKPDVITGTSLPPIAGFNMQRAVNLPQTAVGTTGKLQGFAYGPDALAFATRLPDDYTKAFPGVDGGGTSEIITHPSGISFLVVKYIDHKFGKARWRAALQFGSAAGNGAAGQIIRNAT